MPVIRQSYFGTLLTLVVAAAALTAMDATVRAVRHPPPPHAQASTPIEDRVPNKPNYDYTDLRNRIIYARATLAETRRALTDTDPAALSNTLHALYAMRWHRGVVHLLNGMWAMDREKYPELAWDLIADAPARIALASTLNRVHIVDTERFLTYVRAHETDPHEFNRAQVAVALGLNGDRSDLPYLREMADGENHYVAQSAITGLSLFGGAMARETLIELAEKHHGTPRGALMQQLLRQAYNWPPAPSGS
ncbi:MAG: HEAT repeat domain-containing protein [Proteobacteria bacterium]|nr:HEAT repeat domain-containing protein [Pseudomonadota bacterium]